MNKDNITKQLSHIFQKYDVAVGQEILNEIVNLSTFRIIGKGTVIKHIGDSAASAGLVIEGMTWCYYIDDDGNDITRGFSVQGTFCMDEGILGFDSAVTEWETLEDSTIMLFDVKDMKRLINKYDELKDAYIHTLELALKYKLYRENGFLTESAAERYIHLRKLFPEICANVKQQYIATYLGIMPESLSRIRKSMK